MQLWANVPGRSLRCTITRFWLNVWWRCWKPS